MSILVTGGAGYIGSHTLVLLLESGRDVVVVDNLSNSKEESLRRVERITGKKVKFYKTDLLDMDGMDKIFRDEKIDAVIHFAGFKAVGESVRMPLEYYHNNVTGSLNLFRLMNKYGVKRIVFSSSATVYNTAATMPVTETAARGAINPYGMTKLMIEDILHDMFVADNTMKIILLRYFNPVGAHESGLIGEDPRGIPNNLMPYISQVAVGKLAKLSVFGGDYDTPDGTGVRDYIHVFDLARGHLKALEKIDDIDKVEAYNLGTGNGVSVLELVTAFSKASGVTIPYEISARRAGDAAAVYANPQKAWAELGFTAEKTVEQMCADAWRWQSNNPGGY